MSYIRKEDGKRSYVRPRIIKNVPFFLFFLFAVWLHSRVGMRDWDDYVYKDAWNNITIGKWIKDFYVGWSGRIPLQMMHIIFLQLPLGIWRVWGAVLYTCAVFMVSKIARVFGSTSYKMEVITNIMVCIAYLAIPYVILNRTVLWIAGSFNYLLPSTCMLVALYPFCQLLYQETVTRCEYIEAFIAAFFACYAEQTAAVFVCLAGGILLYTICQNNLVPKSCVGIWLWGIINMVIEYIAPGNYVRYDAEVILWNGQYDMYSVVDKLLMGFIYCMQMLLTYGWLFFLVIYVLILITTWKSNRNCMLLCVGCMVYFVGLRYVLQKIEVTSIFQLSSNIGLGILFVTIFGVLLNITLLSVVYMEKKAVAFFLPLAELAAFASGSVAAMSPSCFVSEQRIFFVSYILLILVIGIQTNIFAWKARGE